MDEEQKNPILGEYNEDGSIKEKPALDINGGAYEVIHSLARIGKQYFVVLPVNFNDHARLNELRLEFDPDYVDPDAKVEEAATPAPTVPEFRSRRSSTSEASEE